MTIRSSLDNPSVTVDTRHARCTMCIKYIDDSPSDDFCSESCQKDWCGGHALSREFVQLRERIDVMLIRQAAVTKESTVAFRSMAAAARALTHLRA